MDELAKTKILYETYLAFKDEAKQIGLDESQTYNYLREKFSREEMEIIKSFTQISTLPENVDKLSLETLTNPNFFENIVFQIQKKVVGETDTIKTILLCACGTFVDNSTKTSYNLIVHDVSGVGKDWITSRVLEAFPDGMYIKRTRISEKVLNYWHNPKFEPDWTWDNKIFYNEDISDNVMNSEVFKVMASTGSHATILVNQVPIDIEIRGKPVIIVTTASTTPSEENLRRFNIVGLDSSKIQSVNILERQAELAESGINPEYDENIIHTLQCLRRVKIKIPFAKKIRRFFSSGNVIVRTQFLRFLDYIKASAALHQYQRMLDSGFVLAEETDYEIARKVMKKLSFSRQLVPFTKDQRKIAQIFKKLPKEWYSVNDLEEYVTFMSEKWLRVQLERLATLNVIKKASMLHERSGKKVMVYKYVRNANLRLPEWDIVNNKEQIEQNEQGEGKGVIER